jgi:hypothetical protein
LKPVDRDPDRAGIRFLQANLRRLKREFPGEGQACKAGRGKRYAQYAQCESGDDAYIPFHTFTFL